LQVRRENICRGSWLSVSDIFSWLIVNQCIPPSTALSTNHKAELVIMLINTMLAQAKPQHTSTLGHSIVKPNEC